MAATPFFRSLHSLFLLLIALALNLPTAAVAHPYIIQHLPPAYIDIGTNLTKDGSQVDYSAQQPITQAPASDGAGVGFSLLAVGWIVLTLVFGGALALAGLRAGPRAVGGMAGTLISAVCAWAAIINSTSGNPGAVLPDAVIAGVMLGIAGVCGGLFAYLCSGVTGGVLLGVCGGAAVGVRLVLVKRGLLIEAVPLFMLNWALVVIFAIAGGLVLAWRNRVGISVGSASVGTFFVALGIDLILNKQAGMSRGLRFLFDRNSSHIVDIINNGYNPPLSTQINLAVSFAFIPILALAQLKIFPERFSDDANRTSLFISKPILAPRLPDVEKSRFSLDPI